MLHCFLQTHPLVLLLQQTQNKILGEVAVLAPGWALEGRLTLNDVLNGAGVEL